MKSVAATELAVRLRLWATGDYRAESAVELLIAQESWLRRADFVAECVELFYSMGEGYSMASIQWDAVPAFLERAVCSSGEAKILMLACSLAGRPIGESLWSLMTGLGDRNTTRVLQAMAHLNGWHERQTVALIDGTVD